jgi:Fe-S cluster biosynthesis and repair protein YggX
MRFHATERRKSFATQGLTFPCEIIFLHTRYEERTMAERMVNCVKLKKQLPGLDEPPFDTDLGQKIYENVSRDAWNGWTEFCKMLLNEYRLNPARREDQEVIVKQMEQYFFGEGAAPPKEYVPPASH